MKFLARIIFRINNGSEGYVFDEQLHLLDALSNAGAMDKAEAIGRMEEEWVECEGERKLFWEFIGISDLREIKEQQSNSLIYSFSSSSRGPDYINFVRSRHQYIREFSTEQHIQHISAHAKQAGTAHL
jgi:hypothetical protein